MGVTVIFLVEVFLLMKIIVIGAAGRDNGEAVSELTLQGEKWKEETKLTASDAALGDFFGSSVAISRDTLIVGDPFKDGNRGATYVSVRAGDGS